MEGFDNPGVFFSDNFAVGDNANADSQTNLQKIKKLFKDFIRQFHIDNYNYKYRDDLRRNYNLGKYYLEVNLEDVCNFNEVLADKLYKQPAEHLPIFEEAAKEVADLLTAPRLEGEETMQEIQIMLTSNARPTDLRKMMSEAVSRLVKVSGIVVSASGIKAKAQTISIQCRSCKNVIPNLPVKPGLEGFVMPRKCTGNQGGMTRCPLDPYFIMPDKCHCVDFQVLKLQELPDTIPQGEIPRHLHLYCDRFLCERVVPGNRICALGIYSIKKVTSAANKTERDKAISGVRASYIRLVGVQFEATSHGLSSTSLITTEEENLFRRMASSPHIYEKLAKSIAPSIFGADDIKKAIACLLFGGSRKIMPDGLTRRGDINILLLGDPGTAKSQLLKFVERVSPIGVYTSGKGSSAAGLTASVMRDPTTRNFVMEGGAMILADGGVVCIDEFDKMREDDRVAIHEAMEQQTISIAKAGITTTLNSRCSVLAAANSIFGRWNDSKGEENIDFMPTILSRFDMIFIVKDEHNQARDMTLARHIMGVHMNAAQSTEDDSDLSLDIISKYINFCRRTCGPRLHADAAEKLKRKYVMMRSDSNRKNENKNAIPITVRQLEAIIRISESLAKMRMLPFATESHVDEALRLFQVSTLDAAMTGSLAGGIGFSTEADQDMLSHIEKQLKRRFAIGTQVYQQTIIQDFTNQNFPEHAINTVIFAMIRRGQLQHRMQRKMLYRIS